MKNLTIANIRSKCTKDFPGLGKADLPEYYLWRPISYPITWLFLRLGISANQTTLIAFIIGVIGCAFLALGLHWSIIVGAILLGLNMVLDRVDGNIARVTGSSSPYGEYIDRTSDYILTVLPPIAIGIGLYLHPDPYLGFSGITYLILGMTYALLRSSICSTSLHMHLVFSTEPLYLLRPHKGGVWKLTFRLGSNLILAGEIMLLLAAVAHALSIYLVFYTLIATCELTVMLIKTLMEGRNK